MEKLFNIVFKDTSEDEVIQLLEEYLKVDLAELDEVWDKFRYNFVIYRSNRIKSSNIKYINYNSDIEVMTITFNNNSVYEYYNVPMMLYLRVRNGLATPTSTGSNRWGKWNPEKFPSNGAALDRFVKKTGISYRKIR